MTEASAPEMNADPDAAQLIAEDVDVMVPAANGAELRPSLGLELVVLVLSGNGVPGGIGEERVIDRCVVGLEVPAHAEADLGLNLVRDVLEIGGQVVAHELVCQNRSVPAGDIEANSDHALPVAI